MHAFMVVTVLCQGLSDDLGSKIYKTKRCWRNTTILEYVYFRTAQKSQMTSSLSKQKTSFAIFIVIHLHRYHFMITMLVLVGLSL